MVNHWLRAMLSIVIQRNKAVPNCKETAEMATPMEAGVFSTSIGIWMSRVQTKLSNNTTSNVLLTFWSDRYRELRGPGRGG